MEKINLFNLMKKGLGIAMLCFLLIGFVKAEPIIADHNAVAEFDQFKDDPAFQSAIETAKGLFHIGYGHTSHGSQITSGMSGLNTFMNGLGYTHNLFSWNNGGTNGALDLEEGAGYGNGWLDHDCGYTGWDDETRYYLDGYDPGAGTANHSDVNIIMWSWCGEVDSVNIQSHYLDRMANLENEYPDVIFIYMTGHLEGKKTGDPWFDNNNAIRANVLGSTSKVLFDFADIEKYDPDQLVNYADYYADDNCDYDSDGQEPRNENSNWAIAWQNSHTQNSEWYSVSCAHSQSLNCNQKAKAFWWMMARLTGWNSEGNPVCGNGVQETGEQCDDGNTITESCNYGQTSCTVCDSNCQNAAGATSYCGDGFCDSTYEDSTSCSTDCSGSATVLFQETFEDTNFASRGWYDNTGLVLSSAEYKEGASSAEFHFLQGGTTPTSGMTIRHKFTDTDEVYVSYWVKYSTNWEGSNRAYHPHEFLIMTNENSDWTGPAYTYLTAYIEQNEGEPLLGIQDGQDIDESNIGVDLVGVTESRSVAGCNGDSDGYGAGQGPYNDGECYNAGGGTHWNGKSWRAGSVYFQDNPGQYYKNDWHHVEAYFKLNSISGGVGIADGIVKYWYDGQPLIDHSDVMFRTAQHPNMKFNQFLIGPWIGDGSPIDQTFWVDDLIVGTSRVEGTPPTCTDIDGDGYGVGASCLGPDCDDNDNNRNPGSTELCTGGVDEDCDGQADCNDIDCSSDPSCQVTCAHEADNNPCDGTVSLTELIDYMDEWKAGQHTLVDIIGAVVAWKG